MATIRVHYTSHACLVANPTATRPNEPTTYGPGAQPRWIPCRPLGYRPLMPARNRYSTTIAEVTCARCLEDYRTIVKSPAQALELEITAHAACCASRGAPLLADRELVAQLEREVAADEVAASHTRALGLLGHEDLVGYRARIEAFATALAPLLTAGHLKPVVDELTMAGDVLVEVAKMIERARSSVAEVCDRIRTGGIDYELVRNAVDNAVETRETLPLARAAYARRTIGPAALTEAA